MFFLDVGWLRSDLMVTRSTVEPSALDTLRKFSPHERDYGVALCHFFEWIQMMPYRVLQAINRAKFGIPKYLWLMDRLNTVDVSSDADFQRAYNGFYRVQRRRPDWYTAYYKYLEQSKTFPTSFPQVLDHIYQTTGRYEPSFASKLVATLNPHKPVWDKHVLSNLGRKAPGYYSRTKMQDAKGNYEQIESWYKSFLVSEEGSQWVQLFDEHVSDHHKMTDLKKVDFILWQIRS